MKDSLNSGGQSRNYVLELGHIDIRQVVLGMQVSATTLTHWPGGLIYFCDLTQFHEYHRTYMYPHVDGTCLLNPVWNVLLFEKAALPREFLDRAKAMGDKVERRCLYMYIIWNTPRPTSDSRGSSGEGDLTLCQGYPAYDTQQMIFGGSKRCVYRHKP